MSIVLDTLSLPDALVWQDEFDWVQATGALSYTLQGRAVFELLQRPSESGRSITLGHEHGWLDRADLLELQEWAAQADRQMLLSLHDGRTFTVVFRLWDQPVLEAEPVAEVADPADDTRYRLLSLKLAVV